MTNEQLQNPTKEVACVWEEHIRKGVIINQVPAVLTPIIIQQMYRLWYKH